MPEKKCSSPFGPWRRNIFSRRIGKYMAEELYLLQQCAWVSYFENALGPSTSLLPPSAPGLRL